MNQPHILLRIERISRITQHLPRDYLEKFTLKLVENFLKREIVYAQYIESLKSQSEDESQSVKNAKL